MWDVLRALHSSSFRAWWRGKRPAERLQLNECEAELVISDPHRLHLCGVQIASLAEALAMIERSGLQPAKAVGLLTQGAPGSPLVNAISARMMQRQYEPNFYLQLMAKDLQYATVEAAEQGIDAMTGTAALRVFERAVAEGLGEQDIAAVVEPFRTR